MGFIEIKNGKILIDDSEWEEKSLIGNLVAMIEKRGFDERQVSTGFTPCPDLGYFELAGRFWRASLCIYFAGASRAFWESGVGFAEPWLFNAYHSIELNLKGFLLSTHWLGEVQHDKLSSGLKTEVKKLAKKHGLTRFYDEYKDRIKLVINEWDKEDFSKPPELDKMLLTGRCEGILKEIEEAGIGSFRFRYPSLAEGKTCDGKKMDQLQVLAWKFEESQLFPITGLPQKAGYFFDHIKVINSLHEIIGEIKSIASYHGACWDFIGNYQDVLRDLMKEWKDY